MERVTKIGGIMNKEKYTIPTEFCNNRIKENIKRMEQKMTDKELLKELKEIKDLLKKNLPYILYYPPCPYSYPYDDDYWYPPYYQMWRMGKYDFHY